MGKRSRENQEINAGSMADIAFLLLIFFLVTTTMDQDTGILRLLPPPLDETIDPPPVKEKNVYEVLVNANDLLLVEGELKDISELKAGAIEFFTNPENSEDLPEKRWVRKADCESNIAQIKSVLAANPKNFEAKQSLKKWEKKLNAVELLGEYKELPSSAIVSLQNDNGTSYDMYIQVQNELQSAINELRDQLSLDKFGKRYNELDPLKEGEKEKIKAIRAVFPQRISEAEPKNTGN